MHLLMSLVLALVAAPVPAMVQAAPPKQPPTPTDECYQLKFAEITGVNRTWARIRVGDEWISGCVGPAGKCLAPVWVPCDE